MKVNHGGSIRGISALCRIATDLSANLRGLLTADLSIVKGMDKMKTAHATTLRAAKAGIFC